MKIHQKKKLLHHLPIGLVILLTVVGGIGLRWHTWTFVLTQKSFIDEVMPLIQKMHTYSELDLSFLSGDVTSLSRKIYGSPETYIFTLKKDFTASVDSYNGTAEFPLFKELDIGIFTKSLSVEQKVAQLFIFGFEGTELSEDMRTVLETHQPGGVILMGHNITDQLSGLTNTLQSLSHGTPFFVAVDQEGGQVARVKESLPSQSELIVEEVCPTYLERSEFLKSLGINLNFGIIADVTDDPSSFIYARVFRDEVNEKVTDAVQCTTETLSTLKHFPGHGITVDDSHGGVVSVGIDREERENTHLPPFKVGIQAGVDVIMSAHLQIPWIDLTLPVSLSISGINLLREQGFEGVIVTDDLGMLRADYSEKEAIKNALIAGNDLLLLVNPSNPNELLAYTADLVREGVITQQELDIRISRILRAKNKIIKLGRYIPLELMQ